MEIGGIFKNLVMYPLPLTNRFGRVSIMPINVFRLKFVLKKCV